MSPTIAAPKAASRFPYTGSLPSLLPSDQIVCHAVLENHWLSWYGVSFTALAAYCARRPCHPSQILLASLPSVVDGKLPSVSGPRAGAADVAAGAAADVAGGALKVAEAPPEQ